MSENKELKRCELCKNKRKELQNEELEKVSGGGYYLPDGKYVCDHFKDSAGTCLCPKTINGVANVCTCSGRTNGECCKVYGNKSICEGWNKELEYCESPR